MDISEYSCKFYLSSFLDNVHEKSRLIRASASGALAILGSLQAVLNWVIP